MIEVTRLNGTPMILNSDLIKIAESSPDTMLTLIHGEKLIVRESCSEIMEKVLAYRANLLAAVGARAGSSADLHRVVAMTSLTPDGGRESQASPAGDLFRPVPALKLEQGGRQAGDQIG